MDNTKYDFLKSLRPDRFFLLAGPCVIEDETSPLFIAETLKTICQKLDIPLVFKGSYRKANRSRLDSFTGIGDEKALKVLQKVAQTFEVPVVTDIHSAEEAAVAAEYVDILQIPAFLCRQTDLLVAAAKTGKTVNIKKGQFLSGEAMGFAVEKVRQSGNDKVMLTELDVKASPMFDGTEEKLPEEYFESEKLDEIFQVLAERDIQICEKEPEEGDLVLNQTAGETENLITDIGHLTMPASTSS